MASGVSFFLSKTLGEDFMESLQKFELWKPGTKSTLDHEEIRTALQIVPRTVMALLIKELVPMNIGETKEVPLFVGGDAKMRVTKHERDVYSGELEQDNKKVVDFKFRSIPGVGLVIMTAFEMYDMENLINSHSQHSAESRNIPQPVEPTVNGQAQVQKMIDERMALHSLVHQVVESKLAHKDAIHNLLLNKLTEELRREKEISGSLLSEGIKLKQNAINIGTTNKTEPQSVEAPKKKRPLAEFLDSRKKKEYEVHLSKGETVDCPDCGKNIFNGKLFSGCVCLGDDMQRKVFIKKSEDGIKVRFSKGWDQENIEMLLETLRKKHG